MTALQANAPVQTDKMPAQSIDEALNTTLPVLLLVWNGETFRSAVKNELDKAARDYAGRIVVVKADASEVPEIAQRFELGKHPLLIGMLCGEVLGRRPRPWGTDVQGMVEELVKYAPQAAPMANPGKEEKAVSTGKPIHVTDQTFQKEVIESK